jgi:hypothetical protein
MCTWCMKDVLSSKGNRPMKYVLLSKGSSPKAALLHLAAHAAAHATQMPTGKPYKHVRMRGGGVGGARTRLGVTSVAPYNHHAGGLGHAVVAVRGAILPAHWRILFGAKAWACTCRRVPARSHPTPTGWQASVPPLGSAGGTLGAQSRRRKLNAARVPYITNALQAGSHCTRHACSIVPLSLWPPPTPLQAGRCEQWVAHLGVGSRTRPGPPQWHRQKQHSKHWNMFFHQSRRQGPTGRCNRCPQAEGCGL